MKRRHTLIALATLAVFALAAMPAAAQPSRDLSEDIDFTTQAGPKKHQKRQGRPVKLGTSGGNVNDFTISPPFIVCCSGTLGALIEKNGVQYILSNNHVLAQNNAAEPGDGVNQPGMLDNQCVAPDGDIIGELTGYKKLKFNGNNKVDAAIAEVLDDSVSPTGNILEIGTPGNETVAPEIGMRVKKSGRSTALTRGEIFTTNTAGFVGFPEECAEDAEVLALRFIKQITIVSVNNKDFSAGGDSGSMIYEDVDECPRAVGLLFAGNDEVTVANKAKTVLKQAKKMKPKGKATLVGCDPVEAASDFTVERGIAEIDGREMRIAERIQKRTEERYLNMAGVNAMGIGRSSSDPTKPVFRVFIDKDRPEARAGIPSEIEGVAVEITETAPFKALGCPRELQEAGVRLGGLAPATAD